MLIYNQSCLFRSFVIVINLNNITYPCVFFFFFFFSEERIYLEFSCVCVKNENKFLMKKKCEELLSKYKATCHLLKREFDFAALGAAYGTAKAGTGIAAMSVMRPELIMKSIIPVVMAGIIAIYGLVVAVLISGSLQKVPAYDLYMYVSSYHAHLKKKNKKTNTIIFYNLIAKLAVLLQHLEKYN